MRFQRSNCKANPTTDVEDVAKLYLGIARLISKELQKSMLALCNLEIRTDRVVGLPPAYSLTPGFIPYNHKCLGEFVNFPESVVSLAREKTAELEDFSPLLIASNEAKQEN
ncbi:hypothetical protein L1987_85735 [Smallanthus sonchifolius]|uniref:Uncharacterized protein n=1 Tax=Smallanthus sonchifolius TaxID=185202 RepID=A0ACB8XYK5_9ASTR|nr:hypothetical protein L1987_85735 [Smallanthus sonchifolius]